MKQKYVNQVRFINDQMEQIVKNIEKQSGGKAVVIINSDEGPYPQMLNSTFLHPTDNYDSETVGRIGGEDMRSWPADWLQMKFGTLQAVHIPRATQDDLANLSSVNLFRIILNQYAGHKLEYLPECQYGLVQGKGRQYNYADITSRFVSDPDESCRLIETLPSE